MHPHGHFTAGLHLENQATGVNKNSGRIKWERGIFFMDYKEFKKTYGISNQEIAREVFLRNQNEMNAKKEDVAVNNLDKIFNAVFSITSKKGFQAMSMRDLSQKAGISLGALYTYFPGKEKLLSIMQTQGWLMIKRNLEQIDNADEDPGQRLKAVIKGHIFLSEWFRPWFYFTFMESRNMKSADLEFVKSMEKYTHDILKDILTLGAEIKVFKPGNHNLTASMIKSMQQEWYLKRWKYRAMGVTVDQFADYLIAMVEAFCLAQ
jgi:AcrR family transcriptional regulator